MKETLRLPRQLDGRVWSYSRSFQGVHMHHHDELEVNLVAAGTATYLMADRRHDLKPGMQIWLFPAQDHLLIDQSPDYRMWITVFKPALVNRLCTASHTATLRLPDPPGYFCRQLIDDDLRRLSQLCADIAQSADEPARHNAGLGYLLLSAWGAHQRADDVPEGSDVHPAVERAARLIRDEPETLNLDQLAHRCGLSPARLSRLFKQQTGVSLVDFRNRQRIDRFVSLYRRGRRTNMIDAALDAGFGSYPQFHRVFKQLVGCSPAQYRRRLLQQAHPLPDVATAQDW